MDFGWFPSFFKVTSWIWVGFPGFLCGFCFFLVFSFMVSYTIWKASVCHVEKTPEHTCLLGLYRGATIQSRPASTTNCRFLLFAKSCANYGNWLGSLLSRKPSWLLNTWARTWTVMAGDAWCYVYALSFTRLEDDLCSRLNRNWIVAIVYNRRHTLSNLLFRVDCPDVAVSNFCFVGFITSLQAPNCTMPFPTSQPSMELEYVACSGLCLWCLLRMCPDIVFQKYVYKMEACLQFRSWKTSSWWGSWLHLNRSRSRPP